METTIENKSFLLDEGIVIISKVQQNEEFNIIQKVEFTNVQEHFHPSIVIDFANEKSMNIWYDKYTIDDANRLINLMQIVFI